MSSAQALTTDLPEPIERVVPAPILDGAARARAKEVRQELIRRYRNFAIVETTQLPSGDIVDWFDPDSIPGSRETPPPARFLPVVPDSIQQGVPELVAHPEARGPQGTIPVIRAAFDAYVSGASGASSLDDFIQHKQVPGGAAQSRYAGYISETNSTAALNWGVVAAISQWQQGPIEVGTFALQEIASFCRSLPVNGDEQMVGAVLSRDEANFGNSLLRMQTEFYTNGFSNLGNNVGGWAGNVTGFTPAAGAPFGPGVQLTSLSVPGGTQYESVLAVLNYGGNWWIGWGSTWMGYFSGSLFGNTVFGSWSIANGSCNINYYGEVADTTPANWSHDYMGSGSFASSGYGYASYIRNPFYYDPSYTPQWIDVSPTLATVSNSNCYTLSTINQGTTDPTWMRWFFLGGPGGANSSCR